MGRAAIARAKRDRNRRIAELFQLASDGGNPTASAASDVLDADPARPALLDDSSKLEPQTASSTAEANSLARAGHVLAREASDDDVVLRQVVSSDVADVLVAERVWPPVLEDAAAERVRFDLSNDLASSTVKGLLCFAKDPLEAKLESADAGEEGDDLERGMFHFATCRDSFSISTSASVGSLLQSVLCSRRIRFARRFSLRTSDTDSAVACSNVRCE